MTIRYYIEGVDLTTYGVYVSGSKGLLDMPKAKDVITVDIPDYNGERMIDAVPSYEAKDIQLSCGLIADDADDLNQKLSDFKTLLYSAGVKQMVITGFDKELVFMVHCLDGFQVTKEWRDDQLIATFTLKLRDLFPVKQVLKFTVSTAPTTLTFSAISPKADYWKIYWGDGNVTVEQPTGTPATISHTYTTTGTYYIVIPDGTTEGTGYSYGGATVLWQLHI